MTRLTAQAVSPRLLSAVAWVRAQVSPVGFVVTLGQVFLRVIRVFPCQYHSTPDPYSLMCHLGNEQWTR
jgi:hypothetical protein